MRLSLGCAALCLTLILSCSRDQQVATETAQPSAAQAEAPPQPKKQPPALPVQIEMQNVHLHVDDGIILEIERLRGDMITRSPGQPPVFDDGRSYVLRVSSATMAIDMPSLSALLNRHVFGYDGAPLKDVKVETTKDGRLEQKGKLHKGIDVPFSMKASVSATPEGRLKLHMESMKVAGVPAKGFLSLFGLKLEDVADLERRHGLSVSDNDIVIDVGQVLPPPEITGRLSRVTVVGNRLVQTFAPSDGARVPALRPPDPRARNYVYFSSGTIRFGKLTMSDADLQLIDADMRDAFDFFPNRYKEQLVAGYSKNTPRLGLMTYMPDFADLQRRSMDLRPPKPRS
jgi:hypothetical protein